MDTQQKNEKNQDMPDNNTSKQQKIQDALDKNSSKQWLWGALAFGGIVLLFAELLLKLWRNPAAAIGIAVIIIIALPWGIRSWYKALVANRELRRTLKSIQQKET